MLISYAQNFEDVMLWRALRHVDQGCYVDVGAQSPDFDSVSRMFYEHGWRGVHVEPVDDYASQLRTRRPDELVLQVAVTDSPGALRFYDIPETGLSTTDSAIAETHRVAGFHVREVEVASVTLDTVFERVAGREVHWLKIDVEGAEALVIKSWTGAVRPWVLVVESTLPLSVEPTHDQWEAAVLSKGYTFAYFDGLNRFYVSDAHPELLPAFHCAPNVFDGFVLAPGSSYCIVTRTESEARIESLRGEHEQAIQLLQGEVEGQVSELRAEREVIVMLRGELEERVAKLDAEHQMVELLKTEYAEAHSIAEAYRYELSGVRFEAERLRAAIAAIEHSRSWRITSPLRRGAALVARVRKSPRRALSDMVAAGMRPILRHPSLGPLVNAVVKRVPPLHARLRRMALHRGMVDVKDPVIAMPKSPSQVAVFDAMPETDATQQLSVRGRDMYQRLVAERESRDV